MWLRFITAGGDRCHLRPQREEVVMDQLGRINISEMHDEGVLEASEPGT